MTVPRNILRRAEDIAGAGNVVEPNIVLPRDAAEVAAVLGLARAERVSVRARSGSAPAAQDDAFEGLVISLARLNAVNQYEPADLTASVQAGLPLGALAPVLAAHGQWLPLGVARPSRTTIGAAVASNESGPFRLYYGAARDMVIGLRFATSDGRLIKSGGMVVKNVAGYDMAKLLIGSFGTVGIITDVNVKVFPRPAMATAELAFPDLNSALDARNRLTHSVLTPLAIELLNGAAVAAATSAMIDAPFVLAVAFGGVAPVLERNRREAELIADSARAEGFEWLSDAAGQAVWDSICGAPATIAASRPQCARLKVSCTLQDMKYLLGTLPAAKLGWFGLIAHAGSGISYLYADGGDLVAFCVQVMEMSTSLGGFAVVETAPAAVLEAVEAWGPHRDDYLYMRKVKEAFDPEHLLNPGRFVC